MFDFFVDITGHSAKREQDGILFMYFLISQEIICMVIQILYLACKLWKPEEDEQFINMLNAVKKFEPKSVDMITLLQVPIP